MYKAYDLLLEFALTSRRDFTTLDRTVALLIDIAND